MSNPFHILNQLGIMSSFSIAKKITNEEIDKFFNKQKKLKKTNKQIEEILKKKVIADIEDAVTKCEVPGLISSQEMAKLMGMSTELIKNIPDIDNIVNFISIKMLEKTTDKMSLCYFINALVNKFELSEEDFSKFHKEDDDDDDYGLSNA